MLENIIGVNEASELTGLTSGTIKNYCANGQIVAKKIGKTWVIDKIKLEERFKMKERIENYINELQHDIKDPVVIEDEWIYEISEQYSQYSWYGLESVNIEEVTLEDDSVIYLVNDEFARELVKQTTSKDKIIDTLTNLTHELGDQMIVAIFDTEEEAYAFIEKEYPKIDLDKEVHELVEGN